jgi:hypothetical protein
MRRIEKEENGVYEIVNSLIGESHLQRLIYMVNVIWLKEQVIT